MKTEMTDLFKVMKEAAKAEFLLNAATCDVPHTYVRQMATGIKEGAAAQPGGSGSVGIVRKNEQRVDWTDIQGMIREGRAGVLLPPGTEIYFTLENGDPAQAVIVDVDHYHKGDAVFWLRQIVGRHCMNRGDSSEGGFFDAEDMREYLHEIYLLLPADLQSVLTEHGNCPNRLFLMTESEQFPFFRERRNRIAYDANGDPVSYWMADPAAEDRTSFCVRSIDGLRCTERASQEMGVAPLFVIR